MLRIQEIGLEFGMPPNFGTEEQRRDAIRAADKQRNEQMSRWTVAGECFVISKADGRRIAAGEVIQTKDVGGQDKMSELVRLRCVVELDADELAARIPRADATHRVTSPDRGSIVASGRVVSHGTGVSQADFARPAEQAINYADGRKTAAVPASDGSAELLSYVSRGLLQPIEAPRAAQRAAR